MPVQMILVAGPYRSGTNDDPALIQKNVDAMTDASLRLFRAGHLPVMGEWYALPLIERGGSTRVGDPVFTEIFHPDLASAGGKVRRVPAHRWCVGRRRRDGRAGSQQRQGGVFFDRRDTSRLICRTAGDPFPSAFTRWFRCPAHDWRHSRLPACPL